MSEIMVSAIITKMCSRCKQEKSIDEFYTNQYSKDGFCYNCKSCAKQYSKQYVIKKPNYQKQYFLKNNNKLFLKHQKNQIKNPISVKICSQCKQKKPVSEFHKRKDNLDGYRYNCKECNKIWRSKHKEKINKNNKNYYFKNKEKIITRTTRYCTQRRHTDASFRIGSNIRRSQNLAMKNINKSGHSTDFLMCSVDFFKHYIEKQWLPGMTWDNYGYGPKKWQIDHIIPLSFFNFLDTTEKYMCFRYQNQRPLWYGDNMTKNSKIIYHVTSTACLC